MRLEDGARDWNRTSDLLLTKEVLYRLSYTGVNGNFCRVTTRLEREAGIEPAYSAWKADVLPLNYSRDPSCLSSRTWWREVDSNHRRHSQLIYSQPPLAAWVSLRDGAHYCVFGGIICQQASAEIFAQIVKIAPSIQGASIATRLNADRYSV